MNHSQYLSSSLTFGGILRMALFSAPVTLLQSASAKLGDPEPITPREKVNLLEVLSGKDRVSQLHPKKSVDADPDKVWRFAEGGTLKINGQGLGFLRTTQQYQDYHLVIEYRWGEGTHGPRVDRARDGGLLLHAFGPDTALSGTWPSCTEVQMIEGGTGNILLLAPKDETGVQSATKATLTITPDRIGTPLWNPAGESRALPFEGRVVTRIGWKDRDPGWTDKKGYRGAKDLEKPTGDWNRMDVICMGDTIRVLLNGELVNEATKVHPRSGYIAIKSEYADYEVRRWELLPLSAKGE
ncbi:MAG: DUF1080 domain-containing protein [Akkermansiaceae bacterium]|nr:DUF1080 domain-containing protein [Akkermansiaceae bacterium]